ncbi:FAD binding domain-containing protein [Sclerotinia borealis F-4128]|uniref:FAD binding domain-containing protein n=1 Tax=Sclerotinia borealis (strain F-4128) TaxID=1432307 RepID=W9BZP1_SCLBF|nr:FAD binding domain-containing protein [Sclerotinia borealis F-4128]
MRILRSAPKSPVQGDLPEPTAISKKLLEALPNSVLFPHDAAAFNQSTNSYWAQQECEVTPACVVRPRNDQELSIAVKILKRGHDESAKASVSGEVNTEHLFAVRSGGHSCMPNAATINGGVLIDLRNLNEVIIPLGDHEESSVIIGAGCRWMDVSKILDEREILLLSEAETPLLGYDIVLASGSTTTVSATNDPDIWRALKGGSNNFGIVTRFKAHSFPSHKIWSGFLYMPSSQATKVLAAFHEVVGREDPDQHAAGPIACFTYIQQLGLQAISVNLVHTNSPEKKWPLCWSTSSFSSLFRLWSTCKVRTLTNATDEMNALNPPGRRQVLSSTTIKNDAATLASTHDVYRNAIASLRSVKGLSWTLVLQPLLPDWLRKGDANPMGLHDINEPLVLVSFTVNWRKDEDDELVQTITRRSIEEIEIIASKNGTGHHWRYLNYCAKWQRSFESYGEENLRFLQEVSRSYDPEGLFQKGCVGGFKLDM